MFKVLKHESCLIFTNLTHAEVNNNELKVNSLFMGTTNIFDDLSRT